LELGVVKVQDLCKRKENNNNTNEMVKFYGLHGLHIIFSTLSAAPARFNILKKTGGVYKQCSRERIVYNALLILMDLLEQIGLHVYRRCSDGLNQHSISGMRPTASH
jgi:hypothetical protein